MIFFGGASTRSWCMGIVLSTALTKARRPALFMRWAFQVGSFPTVLSTRGWSWASKGEGDSQVGDGELCERAT